MNAKTVAVVVGILGITVIETVAMFHGLNGHTLTASIAGICGLAGFHVGQGRKKESGD